MQMLPPYIAQNLTEWFDEYENDGNHTTAFTAIMSQPSWTSTVYTNMLDIWNTDMLPFHACLVNLWTKTLKDYSLLALFMFSTNS